MEENTEDTETTETAGDSENTEDTEGTEEAQATSPERQPTFVLESAVRSRTTRDTRRHQPKHRTTVNIGGGEIIVRRHRRKEITEDVFRKHQKDIDRLVKEGLLKVYTTIGYLPVNPETLEVGPPPPPASPLPSPRNDDIRNDKQMIGTRANQVGNAVHAPTPESLGQRLPSLLQPPPPEEVPDADDNQGASGPAGELPPAENIEGDVGTQTAPAEVVEGEVAAPLTASLGEEQHYHEEHPHTNQGDKPKKKKKGAPK